MFGFKVELVHPVCMSGSFYFHNDAAEIGALVTHAMINDLASYNVATPMHIL